MDSTGWRGGNTPVSEGVSNGDELGEDDTCDETSSEVERTEELEGKNFCERRRLGVRMAEYFQMHRTFFMNFRLSLVVGVVVALACMPSYAVRQNYWLFGQNAQVIKVSKQLLYDTFDLETWEEIKKAVREKRDCTLFVFCSPNDFNRMYNVAPTCAPPQLVVWNSSLSHWDPKRSPRDLWCGIIPERYAALWPNVGQFIVFTVYRDTGSTVRLAWQGLVGTVAAATNMHLIYVLFGPGWHTHTDSKLMEAAIILWSMGVLFLFLFSRAALNTKKFGMSWYISFVMNFLNPDFVWGDHWGWLFRGEGFVVVVTTFVGALLSILATLLPFPLLSIRRLQEDVQDVVKAIDLIWEEAVEYFRGVEGPGAVWRILKRTEELRARQSRVAANFDASWWECFDVCGTRRSRNLMRDCLNAMTDVRDLMYTINRGLLNARCDAQHQEFVQEMGPELEALRAAASALMSCCVASCMDGCIDEAERSRLRHHLTHLAARQRALGYKYRSLSRSRQLELAEPSVFAFFLSYWARRIADYTKRVVREETPKPLRKRCRESCRSLWRNLQQGFLEVWSLSKIIDGENNYENLKFALRAFIPIAIAFLLTTCIPSTIFHSRYDSTMANTLVFLIFPSDRVEAEKDVHRFLAVSLGRLMPMMMVGILNLLGCGTWLRLFTQFGTVVLFTSSCLYVYYTSVQWSYLGCLIAGFGVVPLLSLCQTTRGAMGEAAVAADYRVLAEVSLAVTIHFVVGRPLRLRTPDKRLTIELRQLTDEVVAGFGSYFSGTDVAEHAARASKLLAACMARAPQCDPKLEIAPLLARPFKLELAQSALNHLQLIASDLDMLVVAVQGLGAPDHQAATNADNVSEDEGALGEERLPRPAGEITTERPGDDELCAFFERRSLALAAVRDEFMNLMKTVFAAFLAVLEHRLEVPCPPEHMRALEELGATPTLSAPENSMSPERLRQRLFITVAGGSEEVHEDESYAELTGELSARIAVCVRAVADANIRLHHIKEACLKEDIY